MCCARLRLAIEENDSPVTGSSPPMSTPTVEAELALLSPPPLPPPPPFPPPPLPPPPPNPPELSTTRFGCHTVRPCASCSGYAFGSPASLKASTPRMPDDV